MDGHMETIAKRGVVQAEPVGQVRIGAALEVQVQDRSEWVAMAEDHVGGRGDHREVHVQGADVRRISQAEGQDVVLGISAGEILRRRVVA